MSSLAIFLYEWKHFVRSPFKLVALLLFILAGLYALHNGANLYEKQVDAITSIKEKAEEQQEEYLAYYNKGEKGPKDRPWIDLSTPFWAIWYSPIYNFKEPSSAIVYNIGQAEQYGFYKRVTFRSSPYDADMAEEIANPERLQSGTLDFSFVVLYLLPLLLMVCLYNIKGREADSGFLSLIYTQASSKQSWLLSRVAFYTTLVLAAVFGLMLYGALLTDVFENASNAFWNIFLLSTIYLLLWGGAFSAILMTGKGSLGNTLKMVGLWLVFSFIVPATVHQWVSTKYPANLMTDFIDSKRDIQTEVYDQPDSVFQAYLDRLFPEIINSPVYNDSTRNNLAMNRSGAAVANDFTKKSFLSIEESNRQKNSLIQTTYWFNPVSFFQNKMNHHSATHYQDYQAYRNQIQSMVDNQVKLLVLDTWNAVEVSKEEYLGYKQKLLQ